MPRLRSIAAGTAGTRRPTDRSARRRFRDPELWSAPVATSGAERRCAPAQLFSIEVTSTVWASNEERVAGVASTISTVGSTALGADGAVTTIGAAATYHLLRFYHDHPQLRDELADHRAVDRIRSFRLMDQMNPVRK